MIKTMKELSDYCKEKRKVATFHFGKFCGLDYDKEPLGVGACDYQTIKRCYKNGL